MQHYLILKGVAGLGNRLCTLANAIAYAQKTGRTLMVDWSDGVYGVKGKNIFDQYFKLNGVPHIQSIHDIPAADMKDCYPPLWGEQPEACAYDLYHIVRGSIIRKIIPARILKGSVSKIHKHWHQGKAHLPVKSDLRAIKAVFNKHDIPFGGNYRKNMQQKTLFFADMQPHFSGDILLKHLALADSMKDEVNSTAAKLGISGKNVTGIHVRMTDMQPKGSLDTLRQKIDRLKPHDAIFLATDSTHAEEYMRKHCQNVISIPKHRLPGIDARTGIHHHAVRTGNYTLAETVLRESILDMWLLSMCSRLLYQSNSSFSRIAAVLKNQPERTFIWH